MREPRKLNPALQATGSPMGEPYKHGSGKLLARALSVWGGKHPNPFNKRSRSASQQFQTNNPTEK